MTLPLTVALDIPIDFFRAHLDAYVMAFTAATAAALGIDNSLIIVSDITPSQSRTVVVEFATLNPVSTSSDAGFVSLFCPALGTQIEVYTPVCGSYLAGLVGAGLPLQAAYYGDQIAATTFDPAQVVGASLSEIGTWQFEDWHEVLALDLPYTVASGPRQKAFIAAFRSGISSAMNVSLQQVMVNAVVASSAQTTLIYFGIMEYDLAGVQRSFASVKSLFDCPPGGQCAGQAMLLATFQSFGLPVSAVSYQQQYAPPATYRPPSPPVAVPAGAALWFPFDGSFVDSLQNLTYDTSVANQLPQFTAGRTGQALSFSQPFTQTAQQNLSYDITSKRIRSGSEGATISVWLNVPNRAAAGWALALSGAGGSLWVGPRGNGYLTVMYGTGDGGPTRSAVCLMVPGKWVHVAVTVLETTNSLALNVYTNGVLCGHIASGTSGSPRRWSRLTLGASYAGDASYQGLLDNLRFFSAALNASDVSILYSL